MKNLIFLLFMSITSIVNGQSKLPIVIGSEIQPILTLNSDNVCIEGVLPICMSNINYQTHQYDEFTQIHHWVFGYRTSNKCGIFDQEFELWVTEDQWYYCYTDWCEGFMLFKGDSSLPYEFRSSSQTPVYHDNLPKR